MEKRDFRVKHGGILINRDMCTLNINAKYAKSGPIMHNGKPFPVDDKYKQSSLITREIISVCFFRVLV
jgi:hypothetical protein